MRGIVNRLYSVSKKWTTTSSQHLLIIFGMGRPYLISTDIDNSKKFLNWLRTICAVSVTTVATWRSGLKKARPLSWHYGYDILA